MRNCLIILVAALLVASCDKAVTIDHHITAEFPVQETLPQVSVLFAEEGEADILVSSEGAKSKLQGLVEQSVQGGKVIRYKALAIFTGTLTDDTLEETFWAEPSLEWIVVSDAEEILSDCGFVNVLRARGLGEGILFASSNAYDKISSPKGEPMGFNIKVKEAEI